MVIVGMTFPQQAFAFDSHIEEPEPSPSGNIAPIPYFKHISEDEAKFVGFVSFSSLPSVSDLSLAALSCTLTPKGLNISPKLPKGSRQKPEMAKAENSKSLNPKPYDG